MKTNPNTKPTLAVDYNNEDEIITISGEWVVLIPKRVIWDNDLNYNISIGNFEVPENGIYLSTGKIRLKNIVNVSKIDLYIFKRQPESDDRWFVLDTKHEEDIHSNIVDLTFGTSFDFYNEESYCLKIFITKKDSEQDCSITIDGDDDYTAWDYNYFREIIVNEPIEEVL